MDLASSKRFKAKSTWLKCHFWGFLSCLRKPHGSSSMPKGKRKRSKKFGSYTTVSSLNKIVPLVPYFVLEIYVGVQ